MLAFRFVLIAAIGWLVCAGAWWMSFGHPERFAVWPAAGAAFAFCWRYGLRWLAPTALGVGLWAQFTFGNIVLSLGAAATALVGPAVALLVLQRLAQWKPVEYRLDAAIRLIVTVAVVCAPIGAALATSALVTANLLPGVHWLHLFTSWWLLEALGTLLIAPPLVASAQAASPQDRGDAAWLDPGAIVVTLVIVLASLTVSEIGRQPYAYSLMVFIVPVAAWVSIRCGERLTAWTLLGMILMLLITRAAQLESRDPVGPAMVDASLLCLMTLLVALLLQGVAADRRLALDRVAQQARQDMSTGLLNDRGLLGVFGDRLADPNRPNYGLLGLHLTNFDTLNDLCGPLPAMQLEQSIASLLLRQPGVCAAARLSAGRYALLARAESLSDVRTVAREIYSTTNGQVFRTVNGSIRLQACVGGLLIDSHAQINSEDCLVSLSEAQAIAASVRDPQLFVEPLSQSMIDARRAHQGKIEGIREAIRDHRFEIHAQLIVDAQAPDGKLSYEVLIRLLDDAGHLVQPPEFMTLAVQAQMTPEMDRGVINRVFSWMSENPLAQARTHKCSINLSGLTMSDGTIASYIREQRIRYGIPPEIIVFEITESEAIRNPSAASRLVDELKADGFGIALDDFGVGLATFEYLKRFPIDFLKIDGSFIRNLVTSPIDEEIVLSTVRVARRLNVQTVAEHVQSQEIYDRLLTLGVGHFQGEHMGRVMPIDRLFDLIGAAERAPIDNGAGPGARKRADKQDRFVSPPRA